MKESILSGKSVDNLFEPINLLNSLNWSTLPVLPELNENLMKNPWIGLSLEVVGYKSS